MQDKHEGSYRYYGGSKWSDRLYICLDIIAWITFVLAVSYVITKAR